MPLDYPARLLKASSNDSGHADIHSGNHAFSIGIIPESLSIASRFRYRHHPGILIAFIPERLSPCPGLRMLLWVENRIGPVLDTEGVTHKDGFLAPSQIAKEFNGAQEFGIVNMLFSKFAHTTAMSTVLPFEMETHMSHVRALLLQVGAMNAIAVIDILMEYMAKKNVAGFAN